MAQMKVPKLPSYNTIAYNNLLGVDYQSNPIEVTRRRSPEMVNMISDKGGNPVKRYGYHAIYRYNNDVPLDITIVDGVTWEIFKNTSGQYVITRMDDVMNPYKVLPSSNLAGKFIKMYNISNRIYVQFSKAWYEVTVKNNGITKVGVVGIGDEIAYRDVDSSTRLVIPENVPTITTMLKPNGEEFETMPVGTNLTGTTYGVNLLTPFVSIEYCVTKETWSSQNYVKIPSRYKTVASQFKAYVLDPTTYEWVECNLEVSEKSKPLTVKMPDGTMKTIDVITGGTKIKPTHRKKNEPKPPTEGSGDTGETQTGEWTWYSAYSVSGDKLVFSDDTSITVPNDIPNVKIVFAPIRTDENGSHTLENEHRTSVFGSEASIISDGRLFISDGSHTYYSRANKPLVIDDNYYFDIDDSVVAYAKTASGLAVIPEDTGANNIYIASGSFNETYQMQVYSITASGAGIGAISKKALGRLNDEPLFLSNEGIMGITSNFMSEKYALCRSGKINKRLLQEPDLDKSIGVTFENYFYLYVNNHMYVLDGRHRDASKNGDSSYECYYFDNMPSIINMFVTDKRMYMIDNDNHMWTWSVNYYTSEHGNVSYRDGFIMGYDENSNMVLRQMGTPVKCSWKSVADGDNAPHYYKTLNKKGNLITLTPQTQNCEISVIKDGQSPILIGEFANKGNNTISFDVITKRKVKKYKRLQLILSNSKPEPFGLVEIVKTSITQNFAKR